MVTIFGLATIGTAFVKSYNGLIVTRVFLGMAEGGTLVGSPCFVCIHSLRDTLVWLDIHHVAGSSAFVLFLCAKPSMQYYRRSELVLRVGIWCWSAPLAGACTQNFHFDIRCLLRVHILSWWAARVGIALSR